MAISLRNTFGSTSSVYDEFHGDLYFPFNSEAPAEGSAKSTAIAFESLFLSLYPYSCLYPFRFLDLVRFSTAWTGRLIICTALWRMASLPRPIILFTIPEVEGFVDAGEGSCTLPINHLTRKGMETLRCDISCIIPSCSSWDCADKDSVGR